MQKLLCIHVKIAAKTAGHSFYPLTLPLESRRTYRRDVPLLSIYKFLDGGRSVYSVTTYPAYVYVSYM